MFTKQDQIQFTLHEETRPFQSPPLLSSPLFSSSLGNAIASTFPWASIPTPSIAEASDYSSVVDSNDYEMIMFGLYWLTSIMAEEKCSTTTSDSGISKKSLLEQTQQQSVVGDQSMCYERFATATPGPSMLSPPPFGHQAGSATPCYAGPSLGLSTGQLLSGHPSAGLCAGLSA